MNRLILLRHGRTEANDRRIYCGSTDLSLSESGAEELLEWKKTSLYPAIAGFRVFTTGLRRTEETLRLLYGETPHQILPAWREADFGAFEMRGYEDLRLDPAFQRWCEGDNERNVPPGGESGDQMKTRVLDHLRALLAEDKDCLIVSHGGPIAAAMAYLFPEEQKNRWQWQPRNGEGYLVTLSGHRTWERIPKGEADHGR